jgi:hypothetical protein
MPEVDHLGPTHGIIGKKNGGIFPPFESVWNRFSAYAPLAASFHSSWFDNRKSRSPAHEN